MKFRQNKNTQIFNTLSKITWSSQFVSKSQIINLLKFSHHRFYQWQPQIA